MKRIILSLVVAAMTATASAQPEPGTFSVIPRVGVALANIGNEYFYIDGDDGILTCKGKYREGLAAGVDIQYQASNLMAYSLGVGYARQGCKYKDSDLSTAKAGNYDAYSNVRTNLDYLNVPVMAHLYLASGLSVNAGVQAGFLLHSTMSYDIADITINKDGSYTYNDKVQHRSEELGLLRKMDFAIPVGFSFEYANVVVDFRYNISLTKVYKSEYADKETGGNKVFALTVGYKLDL